MSLFKKEAPGTPTDTSDMSEGGEVSSGPSSFDDSETSGGGADAVPGTPDATPSTKGGDPSGSNLVTGMHD